MESPMWKKLGRDIAKGKEQGVPFERTYHGSGFNVKVRFTSLEGVEESSVDIHFDVKDPDCVWMMNLWRYPRDGAAAKTLLGLVDKIGSIGLVKKA
jgi:hypothetical protein